MQRIKAALEELAHEPLRQPGVKVMLGKWSGYYRIRVGGTGSSSG